MSEFTPPTLYCANHPQRETSLRCNRCEKPICPECAVLTPTGYRCKECVRGQQKIFVTARWTDFPLAFITAAVISYIASLFAGMLGFFTLILAPLAGIVVAEAVRYVIHKRRAPGLYLTAAAATVLGCLPGLLPALLSLLFSFSSPNQVSILGGVGLSILIRVIFIVLLTGSMYTRLTGTRLKFRIKKIMLTHLRIENFAIIDNLELGFKPGLVILTGETGAGKSIILDAIVALLGGQFDATSIRAGAAKARIEATFDLEGCPAELAALLSREDLLDNELTVTIEREIRLEGRTSARINGHGVNLAILREAGDLLVDIHGQSEHLSLMNNRQHIGLLDRYAKDEENLKSYQKLYHHLLDIRRELKELRAIEQEAASRIELLSFQDQEISTAHLEPGEDMLLEQERNRLANAENLATSTQQAISLLDEPSQDMPSITDLLGQLNHELQSLVTS